MKNILLMVLCMLAVLSDGLAQNINWRSVDEDQRNLIRLDVGYDYGVTTQIGYGRILPLVRPAMVGLDISFPMGNNLLDDFKLRLGGQIEILETGGFSVTARIASVFRKYQSSMINIVSFGSDFAVVAGYSSPTWSAGGELGFDKAITTRLMHADGMKESFPGIKDGWYVPTGGHYYYGLQGGKTLGETFDLSLRVGVTSAQRNDQDALVPLYLQLGLGARF